MSDLHVTAGRTEVFDFGPVVRNAVAINLNLAATKMWFTVKASKSDADVDAIVQKTYVQGGALDGIAVTIVGSNNTGTITVDADETDAIAAAEIAYWDLVLEEPGGRRSTIDEGLYRIRQGVGQPA